MKPIIHRNRFYNHEKESIWHWFGNVIKSTLYTAGLKCIRKRKPFFEMGALEQEWLHQDVLQATNDVAVTWLGHATFLVQADNATIITDPVFGPVSRLYPRMAPFPYEFAQLPPIDVVLISHNHMDHLDDTSLKKLVPQQPIVLVPFGDKKHLVSLGFSKVYELAWKDTVTFEDVSSITLTFLPSKHWSGKGLWDVNKSLWGSWLITSQKKTIYFGGDTSYGDHFSWIGDNYGPVDIALLPIGPIHPRFLMMFAHIDAKEAMQAFYDLKAEVLIPMHWGTFRGGNDSFADPIIALQQAWDEASYVENKQLYVAKFGKKLCFI